MGMGGAEAVEAGSFPDQRAYRMSALCAEEGRKVEGTSQSLNVQPMTYFFSRLTKWEVLPSYSCPLVT